MLRSVALPELVGLLIGILRIVVLTTMTLSQKGLALCVEGPLTSDRGGAVASSPLTCAAAGSTDNVAYARTNTAGCVKNDLSAFEMAHF